MTLLLIFANVVFASINSMYLDQTANLVVFTVNVFTIGVGVQAWLSEESPRVTAAQ